jgi:hypothetical protein
MLHGRTRQRCLGTMMTVLLLSLASIPGAAGWPLSPEEDARVRSEWEKVRQTYEREIRGSQKRIAEIDAQERGFSADPERRAEKITRDAVARIKASLKGGGQGREWARTADQAVSQAKTVAETYTAPRELLDIVRGEWGKEGGGQKKLQEAITALQKNIGLTDSYVAIATQAAGAMSARVRESGVLEKATQSVAAAKEAGERLRARWERERAALAREREQREREASQRARGRP